MGGDDDSREAEETGSCDDMDLYSRAVLRKIGGRGGTVEDKDGEVRQ